MDEWKKEMSKAPEAETKEPTLEDLQRQYAIGCQRAGDLQYRIKCFGDDLSRLNGSLAEINEKAAALKLAETKTPEVVAPEVTK